MLCCVKSGAVGPAENDFMHTGARFFLPGEVMLTACFLVV